MCERPIPAPTPPERPGPRGKARPVEVDALAELEFHWGSAYHLTVVEGLCAAWGRDGKGGMLTDPTPEGLRLQILADYTAMRVPRDLP